MDHIDLDRLVDYRAEYTSAIEKYQISGDNLTGLCPFHQDTKNSFSVNLLTGQWRCFSENESGNFLNFWAMIHGYSRDDTKRAYKEILEKYGVSDRQAPLEPRNGGGLVSYGVGQYGADKHLPEDFLTEVCRAETKRDRDGTTYLAMPYFRGNGEAAAVRKRYGGKEFRWQKGSKGNVCLYGEWRLPEFRKNGWAVLVEGESDTQSLWYMGIPAIGIAGASMFKAHQVETLKGLQLYIHKEPDRGGETFVQLLTQRLRDGGFDGDALLWSCGSMGVKDPSELYMKHGREEAARMIQTAMEHAELLNLNAQPEAIEGQPVSLRQPEGWIFSDAGISAIDPKTGALNPVCRTPILLTQRLKSLETGEEKIEVAFKRDGRWQTAVYPRSTIFSSRTVTALADLGCTVTSENARQTVRFLGALEAENIDRIPKCDATSTFGWKPGRRFIPGCDGGLTLDLDPVQRNMAAAYCQNGTLERWIERMKPHRARNKFRFILAASFAAPLLKIVKQRIFFVYNWGNSGGGKTAALKAALSAWGDPERLMASFNATQVGLERNAGFYSDLPLGIDERQVAGAKPGDLARIVYMIAEGKGKLRGNKGGGLQRTHQWRTVALATGEEPIVSDTTQTGVSNRMLELYGGPFDNDADARRMHQQAAEDCGWAGPEFVRKIIAMDEKQIVERYAEMQDYVQEASETKNGSHIAGISVVALADAFIDEWFFGESRENAWDHAKAMAAEILIGQAEDSTADVNENAAQFIADWVLSNKAYFGKNTPGTCYGFFDSADGSGNVYIFPSILKQTLEKAGYNSKKTLKYLVEQGFIGYSIPKGTKKKVNSVAKWFDGRTARFVEFCLEKALLKTAGDGDESPDAPASSASQNPEWEQLGCMEEENDDLPF